MSNWVKEVWDYRDGKLYWRVRPKYQNIDISKQAGCLNKITGYWMIRYNGKDYRRSRLNYYWHNGSWPKYEIDHYPDRTKTNDRIENLRDVPHRENNKNRGPYGAVPHLYISKQKNKECKQGFYYRFRVGPRGNYRLIKTSVNLNELIGFRDGWLMQNDPVRYNLLLKNEYGCKMDYIGGKT